MTKLFRTFFKFGPALLLLIAGAGAALGQSAKLQLDQLDVLANRGSDTVDAKVDEHLMPTNTRCFSGKDADGAEVRDLIKNVKGIYVKSFTFEKENEYAAAEVESVMSQLRGGGWSKIIGVKSK